MNIFQFLGKPADYRPEKKIFQLVKHFDDVNPKAEQGIYHKKVSFPMFGQVKKDGVFCAVLVEANGDTSIWNRTGKRMTNVEHIEHFIANEWGLGLVGSGLYFGELCCDRCSLEVLSGIVNPNRTKPLDEMQSDLTGHLYISFFDMITICEFISGHSHRTYKQRHGVLSKHMKRSCEVLPFELIEDEEQLRKFAKHHIERGEEGAVFKQDVEWKAGAKDWHQMKVVRGVSYDCLCIGWEEGTGKYTGHVANLLFRFKNGKTVKAMLGKGWSMADARSMFIAIKQVEEGDYQPEEVGDILPTGKIFEVYGLQPSSKNGLIRLPKCGELRHDKTEPDF